MDSFSPLGIGSFGCRAGESARRRVVWRAGNSVGADVASVESSSAGQQAGTSGRVSVLQSSALFKYN